MAALQTFPDFQCSVSKVASWSWGMSWSGIVLTSEKWYRFGQFNLDTWNYVAYTAVLRRHLCHLIFAKECTNPEYHGVLIISSKTSESIFFSNEFRTCWDQGTQKDPVPIGFRPQCQCQWVTMNPLGRGQSDQSQAEDLEILERFNGSTMFHPRGAETYWHMLEHPSLVEKLPLEHRYFQRAEDSCESHTSQEVEQGQCEQGSKVLPQAPQYENQMTMHLSRLSWPNFDCKTAFVLTWFLSTISVSGLAGWMPVVQRWQAAGTSQAQVVATSG